MQGAPFRSHEDLLITKAMETETNINVRANFGYAIPKIHMNGSPKDSLTYEWVQFKQALEKARDTFPSESFHGRNHYVKGHDGHEHSEDYARAIIYHLNSLIFAAEDILDGIEEQ